MFEKEDIILLNMKQKPETLKETEMASVQQSLKRGSASGKKPKTDKQLKRELNMMVTNVQTAAEAREVQWRTEIDKARKTRVLLLEHHSLSSKDKIEEISKGWVTTKEKVIPQEIQAMLVHQEQLCANLIADKKKVIDAIQQDLKARDDSFVTDLKKQTQEIQLMLERMTEQDNTLTEAYREDLEQWTETVQEEEELKRSEEKTAWETCMKNLLDTEMEKLSKRHQAVEEYITEIYHMNFEESDYVDTVRNKEVSEIQSLELEIHQMESESIFMDQKIKKQKSDAQKLNAEHTQLKAKLSSLKSELTKQRLNEQTGKRRKEKQQMEKHLKDLNCKAQNYERIQKSIMHFALADTITFEKMWLTVEAEVKELMERALYVDSMINTQVLHLPWEQPNLSFVDTGRRWEEKYAVSQTSQCSQEVASTTQTYAGKRDVSIDGFYGESTSKAEVRSMTGNSNMVAPRTVKRLMELLCDEAGFLLPVQIVKLLDSLDENEQTHVKMGYLFNALNIESKDVPHLVDFLYKYGQQCPKESEDIAKVGPSHSTDEAEASAVDADLNNLIDRNDILYALKSFLIQYKQGSNTNITDPWSVQSVEAFNISTDEAYWESVGNVITPDKLKNWEVTEKNLERHHAVLSKISKLTLEIQSLQEENTEMQMVCMLLQQLRMDQPQSLSPHVMHMDME